MDKRPPLLSPGGKRRSGRPARDVYISATSAVRAAPAAARKEAEAAPMADSHVRWHPGMQSVHPGLVMSGMKEGRDAFSSLAVLCLQGRVEVACLKPFSVALTAASCPLCGHRSAGRRRRAIRLESAVGSMGRSLPPPPSFSAAMTSGGWYEVRSGARLSVGHARVPPALFQKLVSSQKVQWRPALCLSLSLSLVSRRCRCVRLCGPCGGVEALLLRWGLLVVAWAVASGLEEKAAASALRPSFTLF